MIISFSVTVKDFRIFSYSAKEYNPHVLPSTAYSSDSLLISPFRQPPNDSSREAAVAPCTIHGPIIYTLFFAVPKQILLSISYTYLASLFLSVASFFHSVSSIFLPYTLSICSFTCAPFHLGMSIHIRFSLYNSSIVLYPPAL